MASGLMGVTDDFTYMKRASQTLKQHQDGPSRGELPGIPPLGAAPRGDREGRAIRRTSGSGQGGAI